MQDRISLTIRLVVVALSLFAMPALGQEDLSFPTNMMEPAPGPSNYLMLESPEIGDDLKPSLGFVASYQRRPFVTMPCNDKGECGDDIASSESELDGLQESINNVKHVIVSDFLFAFSFLERFQVGLAVPFYLWQTGSLTQEVRPSGSTEGWIQTDGSYTSAAILGDLRLHLKVRILGKEGNDGFLLGAALIPTIPMQSITKQGENEMGQKFAGSDSVTVTPKVLAQYKKGPFRAMANAGFKIRKKAEYYSAEYGHAITFAGGIGYTLQVKPDFFDIEFFAEIYGEKNVVSTNFLDMESLPLLYDGGAKFRIKDFAITAGAGGGIISGIGVPQFQALLGFNWTPTIKEDPNAFFPATEWDVDGDGIDNDVDECPNDPEDLDGFQDEDGCADNDNDNDGIPDGYDSCSKEPEDKDGFRDEDGCPDLDHDEDGIREPLDKCPERAEDYDAFEDEDGCPEKDNDNDGIDDKDDKFCPNIAEDIDQFEDEDGCPDEDNDMDGVPDTMDQCPNEPETLNGKDDEDGCPDGRRALVTIENGVFILAAPIEFTKKNSRLKDSDDVHEMLDIIAFVIKGNTTWTMNVAAFTDGMGDAEENKKLTEERANVIKAYLESKGVTEQRLSITAQGAENPIDSNDTRNGRAANNRVVMSFTTLVPSVEAMQTDEEDEDFSMDFSDEGEDDMDSMDFSFDGEEGESMDFDDADVGEDTMDFSE